MLDAALQRMAIRLGECGEEFQACILLTALRPWQGTAPALRFSRRPGFLYAAGVGMDRRFQAMTKVRKNRINASMMEYHSSPVWPQLGFVERKRMIASVGHSYGHGHPPVSPVLGF